MRIFYMLVLATFSFTRVRRIHCQTNGKSESGNSMPSQITITTWNDMPFSGLKLENGKWVGQGYAFYIFNMISARLNFTYTIIPPDDHVLGDESTGVLGMLKKKKVDVAVAFLPTLPEMRTYCTFSVALDETRLTAVMKRPLESATGTGLFAPFERTVWLLVFTAVIFMGPIIYIFATIRAKLWGDPNSENFSVSSCFWFTYSSLLKQGTNIIATTDSTRMMFATWWIFILILTSFYTANLTAFLTKPQFTLSISSLEDIVRKGYSWVSYKGRMVDFLLSQTHENDLSLLNATRVRRKGVLVPYYELSRDILDSVDKEILFLAEQHYLETLIFNDYLNKTRHHMHQNMRCTYVIMPNGIMVTSRAFGFSHNSSVEKHINEILLRFVEMGIIEHRKEEDLPLAEICPVDLRSNDRQLRNGDLFLTYVVVVGGYTIAAIIFLLEIVIGFVSRQVKNRKTKAREKKEKRQESASLAVDNYTNMLKKNLPTIYQDPSNILLSSKQFINGINYNIIIDRDADRRFVPVKTPSDFMFQYAA